MPPVQHSQFSASASARLLNCPGSYQVGMDAEADAGGARRSTVWSAEGTLAHALSEVCLSTGVDPGKFVGRTLKADGYSFEVTVDLIEAVDPYIGFVQGLRAMGYAVMLEARVDPSVQWDGLDPLDIDLFGTGDTLAYDPETRTLVVGDLKFGRGVKVEAKGNTQLRYYGAGAAHASVLEPLCRRAGVEYRGVETVKLTVIQPRALHPEGPVRQDTLTMDELRDWARTTLYEGVKRAIEDGGQTRVPGDWCRFCPGLAQCDKPREMAMEAARTAFLDAPLENIPYDPDPGTADLPARALTDDELGDLLDRIALVEPWMRAVKQLGHERAEAGRVPPGYKLVAKRATRKYSAEQDDILNALDDAGVDTSEVTTTKILSPAQIERVVGKDVYRDVVAPMVVKESSGTTLAPEGDIRQRIERRTAQEAFAGAPVDPDALSKLFPGEGHF